MKKWGRFLPQHYLSRDILSEEMNFNRIDQCIQENKPFIQLTGIAPSGKLHFGHKVTFDLYRHFSKFTKKDLFVIADIDGYISRPKEKVKDRVDTKERTRMLLADILAFGVKKEDIYFQSKKEPRYYEFTFEISRMLTKNKLVKTYKDLDIGKLQSNLLQYSDLLHQQLEEYEGPIPQLSCVGMDQKSHAKLVNSLLGRINYPLIPPSYLFTRQLVKTNGSGKMSKSDEKTAIFLSDDNKLTKEKVKKSNMNFLKDFLQFFSTDYDSKESNRNILQKEALKLIEEIQSRHQERREQGIKHAENVMKRWFK
jgi:tryptophanyl-tRNA synthetase